MMAIANYSNDCENGKDGEETKVTVKLSTHLLQTKCKWQIVVGSSKQPGFE